MRSIYRNDLILTFGAPTVGAIEARGVAASVLIEVGKSGRASTGEIVVYNLNDTSRSALSEDGAWASVVFVRDGVQSELFVQADIASVKSEISGRDIVSTLAVDTGRRGLGTRVSLSYPAGARLRNIVGELARAAGLQLAYYDQRLESSALSGGWAFMGSVGDALRDACLSANALWRIVGGGVYIEQERTLEQGIARRYAPNSGLIGSPVIGEDGEVEIIVELDSAIVPSDYFELQSRLVSGSFRAQEVVHEASTLGAASSITSIKARLA